MWIAMFRKKTLRNRFFHNIILKKMFRNIISIKTLRKHFFYNIILKKMFVPFFNKNNPEIFQVSVQVRSSASIRFCLIRMNPDESGFFFYPDIRILTRILIRMENIRFEPESGWVFIYIYYIRAIYRHPVIVERRLMAHWNRRIESFRMVLKWAF